MALNINGRMKVKTLRVDFKKEFGLTLRVYDGRGFADDDSTLAAIRKGDSKGGEFGPRKNTKVGNLEDKIMDLFGIKTQVAGSDDSYLCDNDLTLAKAKETDDAKMGRKENKASKTSSEEESLTRALKNNGSLGEVPLKFRTPELCLEAVMLSTMGEALSHVPESLKTAELCLAAKLQKETFFPYVFKYYPEELKSAELCLEAVQDSGLALEDVPESLKTAELCLEAVQGSGDAIKYVPEGLKTAELCLAAVQEDGLALEFVPENLKTAELCSIACGSNGTSVHYVPESLKTPEMFFALVSGTGGKYLELVPENLRTAELCLAAVSEYCDHDTLKHVPENLRTYDLCFAALGGRRQGENLQFVPIELLDEKMYDESCEGTDEEWVRNCLSDEAKEELGIVDYDDEDDDEDY